MQPTESNAPLRGLRILDFTMNLPGPYATFLLASMGAEVIKVEPPRGDGARLTGRFFELVNAGKKSVVLDLKKPADAARLRRLLPTVDVVVEGFRPGVLAELGFAPDALAREFPTMVVCSISAYGQQGPYRDRPGHDLNLQALVGAADLGRDGTGKPLGGALPVADLAAAMTATTAILGALYAREREGKGRVLDVALTDAVQSFTYLWGEGLTPSRLPLGDALPGASALLAKRREPWASALARTLAETRTRAFADRVGSRLRESEAFARFERVRLHALPHYGTFVCKDGAYLAIGIVDEDKFWKALCRALRLGPLGGIPLPARFLSSPALRPLVAAAIARKTRDEWLTSLDLDEVPVSPVLRFDEALDDPQLASRRPGGASPVHLAPLAHVVTTRSPRLGEHTDELLGPA